MPENRILTPDELVNESIEFDEALLEATQNYARSKPWKGDVDLRIAKLREFHDAISSGSSPVLMVDVPEVEVPGSSGASRYNQEMNAIEIKGKISVLTYLFLHFLAQAIEDIQSGNFDGVEPMVKAMTLFKRFFPRSYAKLRMENGVFVSSGLHRDSQLPVQAPGSAPAIGTESDAQVLPPAPQVLPPSASKPQAGPDEEVGEI